MKSRIFVAALALVGLGILDAQNANAATRYADTTGVWSAAGTWDNVSCTAGAGGAVPLANDQVVICRGVTVTVDVDPVDIATLDIMEKAVVDYTYGAAVSTLKITDPAGLIMRSDSKLQIADELAILELSGNATGEAHEINGMIRLPVASKIKITGTSTLGGDGVIVMNNAAAEIQLDGVTVVSHITIKGKGVIGQGTSAGIFINEGMVHANALDGTLDLQENTYRDGERGVYAVSSDDGAVLKFNASIADATQLASSFLVRDDATLDIDKAFATTGVIRLILGDVTCDPGTEPNSYEETCVFCAQ